MNINEFLQEVRSKDVVPSDFELRYGKFRKYQDIVVEIMREFHRICEKNSIEYQMAYGSLIGAVRDEGQIPWDYDADVFVPCVLRTRLIEVLKGELNSKYYIDCPETNDKCPHFIMRIAPIGYSSAAVHLDVFFIAGLPQDAKLAQKHIKRIQLLSEIRYYRYMRMEYHGRLHSYLKFLIYKAIYTLYPIRGNMEEYLALCVKYPTYNSNKCLNAKRSIGVNVLDSECLRETMLIKTSLGELRIPVQYDKILQSCYGNYKQIPSLDSRIKEVYRSLEHIECYESK